MCKGADCSVGEVMEGLRLCLLRYAAEDNDLGRFGRVEVGEVDEALSIISPAWLYEALRLIEGVEFREEAGDCAVDGGVYGIVDGTNEVEGADSQRGVWNICRA